MPLRLRPLHDRIIVRRDAPKTSTSGGIVIVESYQKKPRRGEVLAVGAGIPNQNGKLMPMALNVGDRIIFGQYVGIEVEVEGEKYQIMRECDVVGVLDGKGDDIQCGEDASRRDEVNSWYQ